MEKLLQPTPAGKVSQIANLFQRKPIEIQPVEQLSAAAAAAAAAAVAASTAANVPVTVVRTESHSARFNNARALFEKLGVENNSNVSGKVPRSGSREDNTSETNHSDRSSSRSSDRSVSPPKRRSPFPSGCNIAASMANNNCALVNGGVVLSNSKFIVDPNLKLPHNISRMKDGDSVASAIGVASGGVSTIHAGSGCDKPDKPERKFNSRELIEKQKKWTSHFTKTKSNRTHSDLNRCDIIRTGPGTGLIPGSIIQMKEKDRDTANAFNIAGTGSPVIPPNVNNKHPPQEVARSVLPPHVASSGRCSLDKSPSPPLRGSAARPEIKARSINKINSPTKSPPLPPIPAAKPINISPVKLNANLRSPTKSLDVSVKSTALDVAKLSFDEHSRIEMVATPLCKPKKSGDLIEHELDERVLLSNTAAYMGKRPSVDSMAGGNVLSGSTNSAASASSAASSGRSGPSSPVHTEDEKQENESTEKECETQYYHSTFMNQQAETEAAKVKPAGSKQKSDSCSENEALACASCSRPELCSTSRDSGKGSEKRTKKQTANKRSNQVLVMNEELNRPDFMNNYDTVLVPPGKECVVGSASDKTAAVCTSALHIEPEEGYFPEGAPELLDAIRSELRGDAAPGANEYLEKELTRYKEFSKIHSKFAVILDKMQSHSELRSFLLIQFQNDLVQLIREGPVQPLLASADEADHDNSE